MSDDTQNEKSASREIMEFIMANEVYKKQRREFHDFYSYVEAVDSPGIRIESLLTEATRAQVGRFTARRDTPHFAGDAYHGHCEVGGGCEVAWSVTGIRRHASKFPANVPHDAKAAVAKVLNVSPDILEAFWIEDDGTRVLLLESRRVA